MMKITLQVSGREMTFSEEELVLILEKHFATKETQQKEENTQTAKNRQQVETKVAQVPTEGKWFEVNPKAIDQSLFSKPRNNKKQEETRKLILEAFAKMRNNSKYVGTFKTMRPKKRWNVKKVDELKEIACYFGGHMADWVEQALEWAQRISNGETWESVCNEPDTANWYRLVIWKSGCPRLVGGSCRSSGYIPASDVCSDDCNSSDRLVDTVPLVVSYK